MRLLQTSKQTIPLTIPS